MHITRGEVVGLLSVIAIVVHSILEALGAAPPC